MPALHFSKNNFEKEVLKSDKPAMVDFFASWCGPCRLAGPVIDQLAEEYKSKMVIGKIDVDQEQELASQYGVMSIPTVIILKNGQEIGRQVGFPGKNGYETMIKKALA